MKFTRVLTNPPVKKSIYHAEISLMYGDADLYTTTSLGFKDEENLLKFYELAKDLVGVSTWGYGRHNGNYEDFKNDTWLKSFSKKECRDTEIIFQLKDWNSQLKKNIAQTIYPNEIEKGSEDLFEELFPYDEIYGLPEILSIRVFEENYIGIFEYKPI